MLVLVFDSLSNVLGIVILFPKIPLDCSKHVFSSLMCPDPDVGLNLDLEFGNRHEGFLCKQISNEVIRDSQNLLRLSPGPGCL